MKNEIIILIIILMTATIFGCTNNGQSKKDSEVFGSDYVNFKMLEGWEVHPMPGKGTVIWMKGDPRIRVMELSKEKYDSAYNKAQNADASSYIIKKENRNVNGINVNIVRTTNNGNGDIEDQYFFSKNNKYYFLIGWAFTGWNSQTQRTYRQEIDKAVDAIATTIN
ncbi:hypothetical protein [Methanobacterium sp. ACI-7]|uniref:hypothetical protein n=1 Tax=unclassified Methanobacterium TaxID=2627676 RepID=UPI0039C423CA